MRTNCRFFQALVWCAVAGVVVPLAPLSVVAAESTSLIVRDVALTTSGVFQGRFIGQDGQPIAAAMLVVRSNGTPVAESITDAEGRFAVAGLEPGVYEVSAGDTTQTIRVWSNEAAPPTAATGALVSQNVVRAQYGYDVGTWGVVLGLIGIGLGTAALIELQDCCDDDNSP